MTLVYFSGRGDWFIHENGDIRPAIQRNASWFESGYMDSDGARHPSILIERRYCSEFDGFFRLTEEDETKFQTVLATSKDAKEAFSLIKPSIKKLLPCIDPGSAFLKLVEQGKLSSDDFDKCYFQIQKVRREKKKNVPVDHELTLIDQQITKPKNQTDLDPRSETTYLHTIAALYEFIAGEIPGIEKHQQFKGKTALIDELDNVYSEYEGLKKRTLFKTIGKAIEKLEKG